MNKTCKMCLERNMCQTFMLDPNGKPCTGFKTDYQVYYAEYRRQNSEKMKEYWKNYRKKNREKLNKKANEYYHANKKLRRKPTIMKVKFKKLHPEAEMPMQATPGSAGFDLRATSRTWDNDYDLWSFGTGISVEIPEGYVGLIFPRSSVYKTGCMLSNCVGVIDSDYRGEISAKFNLSLVGIESPYEPGDRICQLIIIPIPTIEFVEVEELSRTLRGTGGYGSTGK